jgi:hypothetical protein
MKWVIEEADDLVYVRDILPYNEQKVFRKFRAKDIIDLFVFGREYSFNELKEIFADEDLLAEYFGFGTYDEYESYYYY